MKMDEISVYACGTAAKANQARAFLINSGYPAARITIEQTNTFIYDAATYAGNGTNDEVTDVWIVTGRK